ncbi:MAG: crotonase/enoyl-CoA hydratase family protein [Solirubrobacterales bacterium]
MSELTTYELVDGIATITLDDGKVNALSPAMLGSIGERLDRAEADEAVVVMTGRERTFSAGFDLKSDDWPAMLTAGARTAERMLSFPRPIVIACNGNALAMGAFLLLSADHRVGARGEFKIGLNEVAIGLTLPYFGIALARHRLTRPAYDRAAVTGVILDPDDSCAAGFLDEVVGPEDVTASARAAAEQLKAIDMNAHHATKLRIRADALAGLADGIDRIQNPERGV